MAHEDLIHDWNDDGAALEAPQKTIELDDETLRDGLQSPSVRDPELDEKLDLLRLMDTLGIDTADVGLPGAGDRAREHILALIGAIRDEGLSIDANVACRTLVGDIAPAVEMTQETGVPLEVCAFIGSSRIRAVAEDWDLDGMVERSRTAIRFCVENDMPCMYVTEDTTRADPEILRTLYLAAIEEGARRVCVSDTVGHATPEGAAAVIRFVRELVDGTGEMVKVDWHGHRDRGMGLSNCLAALRAGADRIHGTALGIGERCGNAEMDVLLVNLKLLGWIDRDLQNLPEYCALASRATGTPIPSQYPVVGTDAFETATGVHASAVVKALRRDDPWLANRVYSGVPADEFGLAQKISVGPMSGRSNVSFFLESRGLAADDETVGRILEKAKSTPRVLTEAEVLEAAGLDAQ